MPPSWLTKYPENTLVQKAYGFAEEAHKDTVRANGDPYISHCLAVAETAHDWRLDEASVAAALLHDVVEDTRYSTKMIEKKFGAEVAFLVEGLTKIEKIKYRSEEEGQIENLRKLIVSFSKDLRVVLIKLADRAHNMKTLSALPEEDSKRIARETADIYAPLAYRLGMQRLSGELEDLAFPHLQPKEYQWLLKEVKDQFEKREEYARIKVFPILEKALKEHNIHPVSVDFRAKRYSSLYKKLIRYGMDLLKIYDLVALRVIVKSVEECYAVLGIIHKLWPPLTGRIKDYIARPKPNGYRSLHTTVFCEDKKITEFQIRTEAMHEEAELGIAAHWAYEQIKDSAEKHKDWVGVKTRRELLWVEQLRNWQKSFSNQKDFIESLKIDFFKDRIFVITPHNDVIDLPVGATPVDFAYRIHSDIGDSCVGAKVNGKIVPLDYKLLSGDVVEIMTQKGKKPSADWLRFITTSLARSQIKQTLRQRDSLGGKQENKFVEFEIVNQDQPGYLGNITRVFGTLKINITFLKSETDRRGALSTVIARTEPLTKSRLEQVLVKVKGVKGTKEVKYKYHR